MACHAISLRSQGETPQHLKAMTTSLKLNADQLDRLIDALESVHEPLSIRQSLDGHEPLSDWQEHEALMCRLRTALTRVTA